VENVYHRFERALPEKSLLSSTRSKV